MDFFAQVNSAATGRTHGWLCSYGHDPIIRGDIYLYDITKFEMVLSEELEHGPNDFGKPCKECGWLQDWKLEALLCQQFYPNEKTKDGLHPGFQIFSMYIRFRNKRKPSAEEIECLKEMVPLIRRLIIKASQMNDNMDQLSNDFGNWASEPRNQGMSSTQANPSQHPELKELLDFLNKTHL